MMKRRPGFSLVEVLIALTILSMIVTSAAMLTVNAGHSFDLTGAQLNASQGVAYAVQYMNQDLREAKQVTVNSATSLTVYYPQVASDGTYIHSALDTVDTISYFRGWASTLAADPAGDALLRQRAGSAAKVVCKGVTNVQFSSSNPSSVDITLDAQRYTEISSAQCNMVHRAIFLRNY